MDAAHQQQGELGDLDDCYDAEELQVRDTTRRFVRDNLDDRINESFDAGAFPLDVVPALGRLGLLGMHLDGYGCANLGAVCYGLACAELEACDSGLRSFVSVQGSLCMYPIRVFGSEEQRQRWLPPMAAGDAIGCFGLTEPDAGSDPSAMQTRARRDGGDWVLNGTKLWITNGSVADVAIVWAKTDEGMRGFVVPTDAPGFSARDIPHKYSLRASVTSELSMVDCRLPGDAVLPGAVGLGGPLACLNEARFGIVWGATGAARSCFETARDYAGERLVFGRPLSALQLTQARLVEMFLAVHNSELLALRIGRLKEAGRSSPEHVSVGKLHNVRAALNIAREARALLGANGVTLDYGVMRHLLNLESVFTYEGTNEVHTLILGRALTGHPAFS